MTLCQEVNAGYNFQTSQNSFFLVAAHKSTLPPQKKWLWGKLLEYKDRIFETRGRDFVFVHQVKYDSVSIHTPTRGATSLRTFVSSFGVNMRRNVVDKQQERKTAKQTNNHGPHAAHVDSRNQKRPHRSGHHHARSESQQDFLKQFGYFVLHKKYKSGT